MTLYSQLLQTVNIRTAYEHHVFKSVIKDLNKDPRDKFPIDLIWKEGVSANKSARFFWQMLEHFNFMISLIYLAARKLASNSIF